MCAKQQFKEGATGSVSTPPSLCPPSAPVHPRGEGPHTPSEFYSCSLARRAGGGETQMRAESLRRVVSQTLLETQELMNAARSQCEAQQLQLRGTERLH